MLPPWDGEGSPCPWLSEMHAVGFGSGRSAELVVSSAARGTDRFLRHTVEGKKLRNRSFIVQQNVLTTETILRTPKSSTFSS